MSLLTLLYPGGLNPSAPAASPNMPPSSGGAQLTEFAKGISNLYTGAPGTSVALRIVPSTPSRRDMWIFNNGANAVAIGFTSTVTFATGYIIPAGAALPFPVQRHTGELWAIATVATGDVRVWETS